MSDYPALLCGNDLLPPSSSLKNEHTCSGQSCCETRDLTSRGVFSLFKVCVPPPFAAVPLLQMDGCVQHRHSVFLGAQGSVLAACRWKPMTALTCR